MSEALCLWCKCGDLFTIGTGARGPELQGPWKVPKGLEKQLAAWYDEHQACSVMRFPTKPGIMVNTQD